MATSAVAAQADEWQSKLTATEKFAGKLEKETTALLESKVGISETPISVHCSALTLSDGLLFPSGTALAILSFTKCETKLKGVKSADCTPKEPIEALILALPILHNNVTYILIKSDTAELKGVFVEIKFGVGLCAVPTTPVSGTVVAECTNGLCSNSQSMHLIVPNNTGLFSEDTLKFGKNPLTFTAATELELSGSGAGQNWSGLG